MLLVRKSNLLRKLGFHSQESNFCFKVKDLDSMASKKENLASPQYRNKNKSKISEMGEFKVQKLHKMVPISAATVLFL